MIFPKSLAIILVAFADANAGPCRPSTSDTSGVMTTTVTGDIESTATVTTFPTDPTETSTTTATESDITTFSTITDQEITPTGTTTIVVRTTSGVPDGDSDQCARIPNPYTSDNGPEFELTCDRIWGTYDEIDTFYDTTFENCVNACNLRGVCSYVQFEGDSNSCIIIGDQYEDPLDQPGSFIARKKRPVFPDDGRRVRSF
ncbi:hypothetical protein FHETE_3915 [Fusarium heterosporum]|uniref:Apple domain-containing protein n=1 Tax=Fusarium heterosporum TaxID=42747 RepID=A0A8H5TMC7_FUSHE|nr:hypothetical protein FHETE_3915 [Fusarium heterosporum]